MFDNSLGTIDSLIVIAYLLVITIGGAVLGKKNLAGENLNSYLLAGRSLPWWGILGSLIATETSTVTFLSIPGVTYAAKGNFVFLQLTLGFIIGRILIGIWMMPVFFSGKFFTVYEIIGERVGRNAQKTTSFLFVITRCLADGLRLFLTAIVLQEVLGMNIAISVCMIGVLTIVYTVSGGMKSVIWNDCIQLVVYIGGAIIALFVIASIVPGGFAGIVDYAVDNQKLKWIDTSTDPTTTYTIWSGLIAGVILTFATHGVDQMTVQRYLTAKNENHARAALILSGPLVAAQFALFLFVGVALAVYYQSLPETPTFSKGDRVFASFIVNEMPIVIKGITLAAVFSAAMSTLSSSLNSLATAVVNDFLISDKDKKYEEEGPKETQDSKNSDQQSGKQSNLVWKSRILTLVFGVIQIGVGIYAANLESSVIDSVFSIAGFSVGLILGIFVLVVANVKLSDTAAIGGMVFGAITMIWVTFATSLPWPWYALVGGSITSLSALATEIICSGKPISRRSIDADEN